MQSDKAMYWMTLGVLALATASGFVSKHRAWGEELVGRSIAMASQATDVASNYSGIADMVLDRGETGLAPSPRVLNNVQARLSCAQSVLVRHQADLARLQAMTVRVQMVDRVPRRIVLPNQNRVIEVPQPPQVEIF